MTAFFGDLAFPSLARFADAPPERLHQIDDILAARDAPSHAVALVNVNLSLAMRNGLDHLQDVRDARQTA
ncbi:hypothetical protein [Bradyrhizobium manausense]|uniref:hypothetical protein n=1 Tax=Bradyrhizobium manausense TaxID=989370 RepID=UPI001BA6547B|nr:hypothetical protein [Bradyrhizobium manausense]MBR0726791.1 hypothetical protein [Bradyrhizobium manausense]